MLLNSTGTETSIEDVIKSNKITVLDFWWSGCSPCRRFNKETSKVYKKLKEKGVEVISINSDRGKDRWKFASDKDGISWINLYAGYKSEIVSYYRVSRYPTMFIFNDKLELIGGDVLNPLDLLDYLEK